MPKFAKLLIRRIDVGADRERKRRAIVKQAEEDQIVRVIDEILDLSAFEHDSMLRLTADEAAFAPYRHKAAVLIDEGARQPVGVLAAFTVSIHEGAGKDIVVFHSRSAGRAILPE